MKKPVVKPKPKIRMSSAAWVKPFMAVAIPVAVVAVVAVVASVIKKPAPAPVSETPESALTSLPAVSPTDLPPTATPDPTVTPTLEPTLTLTPAFSIFGTWLPDESTTTWLVNNPPPGKMCSPSMHDWFPYIAIEQTNNPNIVIVKGLHEHLEFKEDTLDTASMTIVDTMEMPEINETSVGILRLESDGRLYVEEQSLYNGEVYCSVYAYYIK